MALIYSNKISNLTSQSVQPFARRLDTVGDGTGTSNAIGNYASPTRFMLKPAAGELLIINELHIYVEDGGAFDSGLYGNNIVLTNGINVELVQGSLVGNLQGANAIMSNSHWTRVTFSTQTMDFGSGNNAIAWRWSFKEMFVPLTLTAEDELAVILQDNFTGLVNHSFSARGARFRF